jgi:hypothetical protein
VSRKSKATRTGETYFEQVSVKALRHVVKREKKDVARTKRGSSGAGRKRSGTGRKKV